MIHPCYQCHPGNYRGYRAAVYGECNARVFCEDLKKWAKELKNKEKETTAYATANNFYRNNEEAGTEGF